MNLYNDITKRLLRINASSYPIIGGGTFGVIRQYTTGYVLKGAKSEPQDFILEIVSGLLYQCYMPFIIQLVPYRTQFRWPFPILKDVFFSSTDNTPVCSMSQLQTTVYDSIPLMAHINFYKDILFQLIIALNGLQLAIGFIHRDLHSGNVMINNTAQQDVTYVIDGKSVTIQKNFDIFIIDLGQSCANISRCQSKSSCDKNYIIEAPAASYDLDPVDGCFNNTHDLRLFCGSLSYHYLYQHHGLDELTSEEVLEFKKTRGTQIDFLMCDLYANAFRNISKKDIIAKVGPKKTGSTWHTLYDLLLNPNHRNIFSPTKLFDFLHKYY